MHKDMHISSVIYPHTTVIVFIINFSTEKQNVLYNDGLIITERIVLKKLYLSFIF